MAARANRGPFLKQSIKAFKVLDWKILVRRYLKRCRAVLGVQNNSFVFNAQSSAQPVDYDNSIAKIIERTVFWVVRLFVSDKLEAALGGSNVRARQEAIKVQTHLFGAPINKSTHIVRCNLWGTLFIGTAWLNRTKFFLVNGQLFGQLFGQACYRRWSFSSKGFSGGCRNFKWLLASRVKPVDNFLLGRAHRNVLADRLSASLCHAHAVLKRRDCFWVAAGLLQLGYSAVH